MLSRAEQGSVKSQLAVTTATSQQQVPFSKNVRRGGSNGPLRGRAGQVTEVRTGLRERDVQRTGKCRVDDDGEVDSGLSINNFDVLFGAGRAGAFYTNIPCLC